MATDHRKRPYDRFSPLRSIPLQRSALRLLQLVDSIAMGDQRELNETSAALTNAALDQIRWPGHMSPSAPPPLGGGPEPFYAPVNEATGSTRSHPSPSNERAPKRQAITWGVETVDHDAREMSQPPDHAPSLHAVTLPFPNPSHPNYRYAANTAYGAPMATSQAPEWAHPSRLGSPTQQPFLVSSDPRFQTSHSEPPQPVDPSAPFPSQRLVYNPAVPPQVAAMSTVPVQQPGSFNHIQSASIMSGMSSGNTNSYANTTFTHSSCQNLHHDPSTSDVGAAAGQMPIIRGASPLPLREPLVIDPSSEAQKLSVSQHGCVWEDWEKGKIIVYMVGPDAPQNRLDAALSLRRNPRDAMYEERLEITPVWAVLSHQTFRKSRNIRTIVPQWWQLIKTYYTFMRLAASVGIDSEAPENQDVARVVQQVLAQYKLCAASGGLWDGLTDAIVAAWTHDIHNGWLACMHRRLRGLNIQLPEMVGDDSHDQSAFPASSARPKTKGRRVQSEGTGSVRRQNKNIGSSNASRRSSAMGLGVGPAPRSSQLPQAPQSSHPPSRLREPLPLSRPLPLSQSSEPSQTLLPFEALDLESAGPTQPSLSGYFTQLSGQDDAPGVLLGAPQGYAMAWEMLREQGAASRTSAALTRAKSEFLVSQAQQVRLGIVHNHVLVALRLAESSNISDALRERAEWWLDNTFLSSNPTSHYREIVSRLEQNLGALPVVNSDDIEPLPGDVTMVHTPPTPSMPPPMPPMPPVPPTPPTTQM